MRLSTLRKIIFWSFVIIYFLIAPAITIHALGFVFDPTVKHFVKTGIISVDTEPKQAEISLNGRVVHSKSPVAISGLRPGTYHVEISRPNYQPWARDLVVHQEEVTRIEHILLIPKELQIINPVPYSVETFLPSDDDKYLYLVHHEQNGITVLAYDTKKRKSFPIVEFDDKKNRVRTVTFISSDDGKRIAVALQGSVQTEYVTSIISEEAVPVFLSRLVSGSISNVRFHPHDSEKLFYLSDNRIHLLDLQSRSTKLGLIDQVQSFEVISDKIYGFDTDQNLFSTDLEGKRITNLLPNPGFKQFLFGGKEFKPNQILMTGKETMFWLSDSGKLLMNRLPYFVDENVTSMRLGPTSERLLYWKPRELWLLDLQVEGKRESFFEEGPQKKLIWKSDKQILFAQLIRQGNYVLAATSRTIELIDISSASEDFFPVLQVAEHWASDEPAIYLDENTGKMYWTGCGSDHRYQLCETSLFEPSLFEFSIKFKKPYHSPTSISVD